MVTRNLVKLLYKDKAEPFRAETAVKLQKLVSDKNILLRIPDFPEALEENLKNFKTLKTFTSMFS